MCLSASRIKPRMTLLNWVWDWIWHWAWIWNGPIVRLFHCRALLMNFCALVLFIIPVWFVDSRAHLLINIYLALYLILYFSGMNQVIEENIELLKTLCRKYNVRTMYVFGSAQSGDLTDESDIDLLISFEEISIEDYTDNYFNLHYDLEKIFNRKIDLVTENSLGNPILIESINKSKQLLYAAWSPKILTRYNGINWVYWFLSGNWKKFQILSFQQTTPKSRRAVERELEIIGEAMKRLLNLKPDIPVSGARRIVDLRNWVIHGYDKVDIVWIWHWAWIWDGSIAGRCPWNFLHRLFFILISRLKSWANDEKP